MNEYYENMLTLTERYLNEYQYDKALILGNELIRLAPLDYRSHELCAKIHYANGKFNNAINSYVHAMMFKPKDAEIVLGIGQCFMKKKDAKSAYPYLLKARDWGDDPIKQQAMRLLNILSSS